MGDTPPKASLHRRGSSNPMFHRSSSHRCSRSSIYGRWSRRICRCSCVRQSDGVKELLARDGDAAVSSDIINAIDKDGRSAFHYACLNDDIPLLTVLLADPRVDVQLKSPKGETAVHMASLYAALEALKLLVKDGRLSLETQNKYGETPMHLTAGSGDKNAAKTLRFLMDSGASLTIVDKWGRGPRDVAVQNAESPLLSVFSSFLEGNPEIKAKVEDVTAACQAEAAKPVYTDSANRAAKSAIFGMIGSVNLKKTKTVEKTMFAKHEGGLRMRKQKTQLSLKMDAKPFPSSLTFLATLKPFASILPTRMRSTRQEMMPTGLLPFTNLRPGTK